MNLESNSESTGTSNRGFASMDEGRQREIARKGGRAAHEKGKAHEFTPDEARAAGRKGGEKVSLNRRHMAEIGRRGGRSSAQRRRPTSGGGEAPGQQAADFAQAPREHRESIEQPALSAQHGGSENASAS